MADYLEGQKHPASDIQVGRWIADYDDPDDFTFGLFHSKNGHWKAFYSSQEADRILEEARVESRAAHREALYRKFEQLLLDEAVLIPLFHEIDYRIAAPSVRGVMLSSTPPFVSYGEISKVASARRAPRRPRRRSHRRADSGRRAQPRPLGGRHRTSTRRPSGTSSRRSRATSRAERSSPGSPRRSTPRKEAPAFASASGAACASTTGGCSRRATSATPSSERSRTRRARAGGFSRPSAGRRRS